MKFNARWSVSLPPLNVSLVHETLRTIGPNRRLLEGWRLSTGKVMGLTILVEFQDITTIVTRDDVSAMLNGENCTANGNFCSVRDYFKRVSNGKLDYRNEVVGPFKLSRNRPVHPC